MSFRPKEYLRPKTVNEVISVLERYGDRAKIVAHGLEVFTRKEPGIECLVDITSLDLDYIVEDRGLKIGALCSLRNYEKSPLVNAGAYHFSGEACRESGPLTIRNRVTVGGVVNAASPALDLPVALIALDANVKATGSDGDRIIPLEDFYVKPRKTVLKHAELVTEVQIPEPPTNSYGAFMKFTHHHVRHGIAIVNVAVRVSFGSRKECKDARIVVGSMAPTPLRANRSETLLIGKTLDDNMLDTVSATVPEEMKPIDDLPASAEYRKKVCRVLVKRALEQIRDEGIA